MKKTYIVSTTLLVLTLVTNANASWVTILTLTGTITQSSNWFYIPTNHWRVTWTATPESLVSPADQEFTIYVRNSGSTVVKEYIGEGNPDLEGALYIDEGGEEYNVSVIISGVESYAVTVDYNDAVTIPTDGTGGLHYTTLVILAPVVIVVVAVIAAELHYNRQKKTRVSGAQPQATGISPRPTSPPPPQIPQKPQTRQGVTVETPAERLENFKELLRALHTKTHKKRRKTKRHTQLWFRKGFKKVFFLSFSMFRRFALSSNPTD